MSCMYPCFMHRKNSTTSFHLAQNKSLPNTSTDVTFVETSWMIPRSYHSTQLRVSKLHTFSESADFTQKLASFRLGKNDPDRPESPSFTTCASITQSRSDDFDPNAGASPFTMPQHSRPLVHGSVRLHHVPPILTIGLVLLFILTVSAANSLSTVVVIFDSAHRSRISVQLEMCSPAYFYVYLKIFLSDCVFS